jgi:hypothetical protein
MTPAQLALSNVQISISNAMHGTDWLLLDTETTGTRPPVFVVDIAAQRMRGWERTGERFQRSLNRNKDIPPEASRVYGYTREILERDGEPPVQVNVSGFLCTNTGNGFTTRSRMPASATYAPPLITFIELAKETPQADKERNQNASESGKVYGQAHIRVNHLKLPAQERTHAKLERARAASPDHYNITRRLPSLSSARASRYQ